MEILRAIERADALLPNQYSLEEKLCWCDEVSSEIRRNIIKKYDIIETTVDKNGDITLPPDITYDLVEQIIFNNQIYEKQDFRSFNPTFADSSALTGKKISVVYLALPKPIRNTDIRGEFNTSENVIEIENAPFYEGDKIQIALLNDLSEVADYSSSPSAYVLEVMNDKIILDRDAIEAETAAKLAIRRVIDDTTVIDSAPYDRMYIEYILAKIALYQHDYSGYNAHMTQYNSLFATAQREFITRSPLTARLRFKNFSIV